MNEYSKINTPSISTDFIILESQKRGKKRKRRNNEISNTL
jgi:hypothetical protein